MISLTTAFTDCPMSLAGYHGFISLPKVAVAGGTLAMEGRQGLPKCSSPVARAIADMHPNNLTGVSVDGEPNPLFFPFVADKGPGLITFHRQAPFF
jgi:hypothetical protein